LSAEQKPINRLKSNACGRLFGEINIVSVSAALHRISSLVNYNFLNYPVPEDEGNVTLK